VDDLDPEPDEFGRDRPKPHVCVDMSKLDDEILALDETHLTELGGEHLNGDALLSRDTRQVPYLRLSFLPAGLRRRSAPRRTPPPPCQETSAACSLDHLIRSQ
jgi:hypothetical protein